MQDHNVDDDDDTTFNFLYFPAARVLPSRHEQAVSY